MCLEPRYAYRIRPDRHDPPDLYTPPPYCSAPASKTRVASHTIAPRTTPHPRIAPGVARGGVGRQRPPRQTNTTYTAYPMRGHTTRPDARRQPAPPGVTRLIAQIGEFYRAGEIGSQHSDIP